MKLFKLLTTRPRGEKYPIMLHIFMLQTAAWGAAFVVTPSNPSVTAAVLHTVVQQALTNAGVIWLGGMLLTILFIMSVAIIFRQYELGRAASYGGYIIWTYASVLYLLGGFWLQFFVTAVPNIMFWGWFYLAMNRFEKEDRDFRYKTDWTDQHDNYNRQ